MSHWRPEIGRAADKNPRGIQNPPGHCEGSEGRVVVDWAAGQESANSADRRGTGNTYGDNTSSKSLLIVPLVISFANVDAGNCRDP